MTQPRALCVFCGSSDGNDPAFAQAAKSVGESFAASSIQLVYGGGDKGLMGTVASSCLQAGGSVIGIIPEAFIRIEGDSTKACVGTYPETASNVQIITNSMHERKTLMAQKSNGFIALPGGYGTVEELMEATTWVQLGIQNKPVILLNVQGFYDGLKAFIENAIQSAFIAEKNRAFLVFLDKNEGETWGAAAIRAVEEWEAKGSGGGVQLDLKWS